MRARLARRALQIAAFWTFKSWAMQRIAALWAPPGATQAQKTARAFNLFTMAQKTLGLALLCGGRARAANRIEFAYQAGDLAAAAARRYPYEARAIHPAIVAHHLGGIAAYLLLRDAASASMTRILVRLNASALCIKLCDTLGMPNTSLLVNTCLRAAGLAAMLKELGAARDARSKCGLAVGVAGLSLYQVQFTKSALRKARRAD